MKWIIVFILILCVGLCACSNTCSCTCENCCQNTENAEKQSQNVAPEATSSATEGSQQEMLTELLVGANWKRISDDSKLIFMRDGTGVQTVPVTTEMHVNLSFTWSLKENVVIVNLSNGNATMYTYIHENLLRDDMGRELVPIKE